MSAARNSTATGTIVTAEPVAATTAEPVPWRGRFAPSPTGQLHIGSLVTALASWLDVRARAGTWLLRIEDLDGVRVVPGATDAIIRSLAALGLESDASVVYQSNRTQAYRDALLELRKSGMTYDCSCTRRELAAAASAGQEPAAGDAPPYPGHCRNGPLRPGPFATRLRTHAETVEFEDRLFGTQRQQIARFGDPVVRRRDGITAYQLAVVVDDAWQGITQVVRGADLLLSTGWQILLQQTLGYSRPGYLHLPLVVEPDGSKLAKSRHSLPLAALEPANALLTALAILQQHPPAALQGAPVAEILAWSVSNWRPEALASLPELRLADY